MKKYAFIFLFSFFGLPFCSGQNLVFNVRLMQQVTLNQAVRMGSNQLMKNRFEEQNEMYGVVNNKMSQVIVIQDYIYDKLKNVNGTIRQGKKMVYIYQYLGRIYENGNALIQATQENPDYAILMVNQYNSILTQSLNLVAEVENEILREDNDFLMDAYDREYLIQNILTRLRTLNGTLVFLILKLNAAKNRPYIEQIQGLGTYVTLDKAIVEDVMQRWHWLENNW